MGEKFKGKDVYEPQMEMLRDQYSKWKEQRKDEKSPFFMIYSDFKETHLKELSGGALKLYLFLGFHVNTFTGECWVSVEKIADYLGKDERTVRKWFEELQDKKLIARIQTGYKRVANTFFLPYGDIDSHAE